MSLDVKIKISGESKGVEQAVKKTNDAIKSIGVEAKRSADASESMSNRMAATLGHYTVKAYAAVTALQAMGDTVKGMVNTSRTFDSIGKSLEVTAGSSVNAARSMEFIRDTAQRLGLDLASSAKAFADLQAAANGTAMEGANTQKIFFAVSQAMSALGKSADDTQGALLAISQMMSKGAVSAEELRGQLGERLPGAFNLMAKAVGVSTAELSKLLEQGKVGIEVLPKFAAELEKAYSNAKLDGIEASLNRIGNAWDRLLVASAKAVKLEVVLKWVADMVSEPSTTTQLSNLGKQTQGFDPSSFIDRTLYRYKTNSLFDPTGRDLGADVAEFNKLAAQERAKAQDVRFNSSPLGKELDGMMAGAKQQAEEYAVVEKGMADAQQRLWAQNRKRIEEQERASSQAVKSAKAAADQLQSLYDSTANGLQKQITLHGDNGTAAEMAYELQFGGLSKLSDLQKQRLQDLAAEKDAVERNAATQQAMWDQLVSDANEFVDVTKAIQEFASGDVSQSGFNSLLGRIKDDLDAGIISAEQAKQKFNELGKAFNEGFVEPGKNGTEALSEYAVQAARNMQSAFADFLFDPFDKGVSGMLDGFLTTIRRMAAEAASAQLMEGLFGKTGSKDGGGLLGPLFGAVKSGLMGMFGGGLNADIDGLIGNSALFANGGIMTSAGPVPLRKYANGGVASSPQLAMFGEGSTPEAYVPLPDGRRIPVAMENGGGKQVVNNITLNISTPNADSFRKSERQIRDQMLRAVNV